MRQLAAGFVVCVKARHSILMSRSPAMPARRRRSEVFALWRAAIQELAKRPNVWVKLGGLGMAICGFGFESRSTPVSSAELAEAWRPYIESCITAFGAERCMFESNFPVDKASGSYRSLWNAFKRITTGCSTEEEHGLYNDVAQRFYRLRA